MSDRSNQFLRTLAGFLVVGLACSLLAIAPATAATTFEGRMLELVNASRSAAGVAPVQFSPAVAGVAADAPYDGCGYRVAGRSTDMGTRNYFSHTILNCGSQGAADMLRAVGLNTG